MRNHLALNGYLDLTNNYKKQGMESNIHSTNQSSLQVNTTISFVSRTMLLLSSHHEIDIDPLSINTETYYSI